jgi:hypothetical protein
MVTCRCGCGETVRGRRAFVDKEHQLTWMAAGGAAELGAISGRQAAASGRLRKAGLKGAARAREIAEKFRMRSLGGGGSPDDKA